MVGLPENGIVAQCVVSEFAVSGEVLEQGLLRVTQCCSDAGLKSRQPHLKITLRSTNTMKYSFCMCFELQYTGRAPNRLPRLRLVSWRVVLGTRSG